MGAGVIWANGGNPIENLIFENVLIKDPQGETSYRCQKGGVKNGIANGTTSPKPKCFSS